MSRAAAVVLCLATAAAAGNSIVFVDGQEFLNTRLIEIKDGKATLRHPKGTWIVPASNLATVTFQRPPREVSEGSFNYYGHNGDQLRGTVTGSGDTIVLESAAVKGLKVPLEAVYAVRFGRLLGAQAQYEKAFNLLREEGRDALLMRRDTRPFPVAGRLLSIDGQKLRILRGIVQNEVEAGMVYGFVRARDEAPEDAENIRVRVHLVDGGRVTLPLETISGSKIAGGGATVARDAVKRLEFTGKSVAQLSDFDPISVEEIALFGDARKWRRDRMVLGGPLVLDGRAYARGLGVHAHSKIEFVLGSRWKSLFARCGIDDAAGPEGAAIFRVYGDGKLLKEVQRRRGQPAAQILVDVAGVDRLVLEARPGESYTSDFCDWVEARVFNPEKMDSPPWEGD
ncbi:MAG: NPCBM/NEW2 domain-containing protein [Planctomycetota bacterium]|nr:NPCBM/NEW2 domain-containing protein [Planctomycetota bacterium]